MRRLVLAVCLFFASPSFGGAQTDDPNLVTVPRNEAGMVQATARARATLPPFLELSRHPKPGMTRFAVKVWLGPVGTREFVWLDPFIEKDGEITGALADEPEVVKGYRLGQAVTVPVSEVTDWMYTDNGHMRGNYTACALLARDGAEAVARFERAYGADCKAP